MFCCRAQTYQLLVSIQGQKKCPLKGEQNACADEGRYIDISLKPEGKLVVFPLEVSLQGPPCPTYDERGKRNPVQPPPPNCKIFSGEVWPDVIPPARTSEMATITAQDNGYWTDCSANEQHKFGQQTVINFEIASLHVRFAPDEPAIARGDTLVITALPYPSNLGVLEWTYPPLLTMIRADESQIVLTYPVDAMPMLADFGDVTAKIGDESCATYIGAVTIKSGETLEDIAAPCTKKFNPKTHKCVWCNGRYWIRPIAEVTACDPHCPGPFDSKDQECMYCNKKYTVEMQTNRCCGGVGPYDPTTDKCYECGDRFYLYTINPDLRCCPGAGMYNPKDQKCFPCGGKNYIRPKKEKTGCAPKFGAYDKAAGGPPKSPVPQGPPLPPSPYPEENGD